MCDGLWTGFNLRRMGAPGCDKEIEMVGSDDKICAPWGDLCISIQSMKFLNFGRATNGLSDVISISERDGVSIMVTMPSKYAILPR